MCSRTSDAVIFDVNVVAVSRRITRRRNATSRIVKNSATEGTSALSITSHDSCIVSNRSPTNRTLPRTCRWIGVRIPQWIISDLSWPNNNNLTNWTAADGECLTGDGTTSTTLEEREQLCFSCDTRGTCYTVRRVHELIKLSVESHTDLLIRCNAQQTISYLRK